MKIGRATKKDIRIRINMVKEQLLLGASIGECVDFSQSMFHITEQRALEYIEVAEKDLQGILDKERDQWLAEHIAIRQSIRKRAYDGGNLKVELEAAKDEARLLGLEPNILEVMRVLDTCTKRIEELERLVATKDHPAGIVDGVPQVIGNQPAPANGVITVARSITIEDLLEAERQDASVEQAPSVEQLPDSEAPDGDDVPAAG